MEKIFQSTWGEYHIPVRSTVFLSDKRNENEHNAADVSRAGARIAFANEIVTIPWSNAVFKNRNSTDPLMVRNCGSGDSERTRPTFTYVFGTNDQPRWEQTPKGSEKDRTLMMYLPNKFVDNISTSQSPRCFPKNLSLEDEISGGDFALGNLLNLLSMRRKLGDSLTAVVAAGTESSTWWLKEWMRVWTSEGDQAATGETGEPPADVREAEERIKDIVFNARDIWQVAPILPILTP